MAAKTKAKNIVSECCPPPVGDYKPSLYLNLEGAGQVSQIKGLKIGEKVQILVEGTVRGLEQRKSSRFRNGKDVEVETGHIDVEGYSLKVLEDEVDFAKLTGVDDD